MKIAMKRSKANLIWAAFWGAGALAWLPNPSAAIVDLPGIIFSPLCAAACVQQLLQYFKSREAERGDT